MRRGLIHVGYSLAATLVGCAAAMVGCSAHDGDRSETESAALSSPPMTASFAGEGAPEPEAAVGKRFVYALSSSTYRVYARDAAGAVSTSAPVVPGGTPLANIFQPVISKLNRQITYASSTGIQTCPASLSDQINDSPAPTATNPSPTATLSNTGCIATPYDSDVYYDAQYGRFWIMTHLRPRIWSCTTSDGNKGFVSYADPFGTCHAASDAVLKTLLHRYIAVAVSKAGAIDAEDPANGFHTYVLVDEYADWPQMMVHDGYLLLNTRSLGLDTNNRVYVFDAFDLMDNVTTNDLAVLSVKPRAVYDADGSGSGNWVAGSPQPGTQPLDGPAVDWVNNRETNVTLTQPMMFVKQQDTGNVTYMVSSMGSTLVVYGIVPDATTRDPVLLEPAVLDLGDDVPFNLVPAAYANNQLYWAWPKVESSGRAYLRTYRIPVHRALHTWNGAHPVWTSNGVSDGYLEADIGQPDTANSYGVPVMNVTPNGDIVTMYSRFPFPTATCSDAGGKNAAPCAPASLRYAVIPHGASTYSSSVAIGVGQGNAD